MSAADLIKSTLDYAALAYAPPPFALVDGEVRRTEGYVVVMRTKLPFDFKVAIAGESWSGSGELAHKLTGGVLIAYDANEFVGPVAMLLHVTGRRAVLARDSAKALFADVCTDLRRGGSLMRQWCETRPFQIVLARAKPRDIKTDNFDVAPVLYASGPRWIPTNERPADETP